MNFDYTDKVKALQARVTEFMSEFVYPNERELWASIGAEGRSRWDHIPLLTELAKEAQKRDLWNLFLPDSKRGAGLTNLEYAPLAEIMGRSFWAPEIFNCDAPNTGNMEVLERFGTEEMKKTYLEPMLAGTLKSAFGMTEPNLASSDASNISLEIRRDGDEYVINGTKWWTSHACDSRCKVLIVMGKSDPDNADKYKQQSMVVVPFPTKGITVKRHLNVFGFDDAPHGHAEIVFDNVRVPAENMLLGEGRGFEIAQARLGPGRIHHCMRLIGVAERALERMCRRLQSREAFGQKISTQSVWSERIAEARCQIDQARLLTLRAAHMMDTVGNKQARQEIAMIKIVAPNMAANVLDMAIQAFGGGGFADLILTNGYLYGRTVRIADGPDEVHRNQLARLELKKIQGLDIKITGGDPTIMIADGQTPPGMPPA
ncbi:acyl-CoA dehydrogenase [Ochrobactrum sp. XJ1]|nr:acyl-CoA dehydrogenase [Ochrobactrum sp. XJ1]